MKCSYTCKLVWIGVVRLQWVIIQHERITEIIPRRLRWKYPCCIQVKQHCGRFIMQRFWLIFTFITQLVFNHLAVGWLNKGVKKNIYIMCRLQDCTREEAWCKIQISSLSVTGVERYCLFLTCLEILSKLNHPYLFMDCCCSVLRPVFLCSLIPSHSIFHDFKQLRGYISLKVPTVSLTSLCFSNKTT